MEMIFREMLEEYIRKKVMIDRNGNGRTDDEGAAQIFQKIEQDQNSQDAADEGRLLDLVRWCS